jgi:hypothetical protein
LANEKIESRRWSSFRRLRMRSWYTCAKFVFNRL